jgi:predicted phosphohydrolase
MKVYAISDLHLSGFNPKPMDIFGASWDNYWALIKESWAASVENDDAVLIAGDISWAMTLDEARGGLEEIGRLKGKKILIRGNHDYWWKSIGNVREALGGDTYALQNDCVKIGKVLVGGTRGWTVPERGGAGGVGGAGGAEDEKIYRREAQRLKLSLESLRRNRTDGDISLCMIHFPPFNSKREDSEFTRLFDEYGIDKVIYGHLHGADCRAELISKKNNVEYFLTSCDQLKNKLTRIL